jgi:hypothetical protein
LLCRLVREVASALREAASNAKFLKPLRALFVDLSQAEDFQVPNALNPKP